MLSTLKQYVYDRYAHDENCWVRRLHRGFFKSRFVVKALFGLDVPPASKALYFDLTTILLRNLVRNRLRLSPDLRLLEIGVGSFVILSGCLSRHARYRIDAVDLEPRYVESSRKCCAMNQLNVKVFQSDLFENVERRKYDVIFWNLPYYVEPNKYLGRLFASAPDYMGERSELIVGYNSKPLPRDVAMKLFDPESRLRLAKTVTWWWNLHEVLVFQRKQ